MRWIGLAWLGLLSGCVNESFVPCSMDSQCPASAPFCDTALKACTRTAPTDGGVDATPSTCMTSKDCGAAKPICDNGTCRACTPGPTDDSLCANINTAAPHCAPNGQCEQCAANSHCTQPGKTFCDGTTFQCRACLNSDCPTGVCNKATNMCVDPQNVFTVDATKCPTPTPPVFCTLQAAITAAAGNSSIKYIVVKGNANAYDGNVSIMNDITIIGPYSDAPPSTNPANSPATIKSTQTGVPVITVAGAANVTLDGLAISGALGAGGFGVNCLGHNVTVLRCAISNNFDTAVVANSPCVLTIDQSIINANAGGGIKIVDTASTIQNSFIVGNGGVNSNIQAVTYSFSAAPPVETFFNNTISDNNGKGGTAGIQCIGTPGTIGFRNSIFWQNYANPVAGKVLSETNGFCTVSYCATDDMAAFIGGDHITKLGGASNPPPGFVASGDYHIQSNSACVGMGTSISAPLYDIDGDPRSGANDIGADQH